jgi:hypothetical protein
MFASPVDFLPKSRRDSSKRMGRVYECSKSMIALPAVPVNLTVSEESRRGLPSSPRPPEVLSPLPPPFRRYGFAVYSVHFSPLPLQSGSILVVFKFTYFLFAYHTGRQ